MARRQKRKTIVPDPRLRVLNFRLAIPDLAIMLGKSSATIAGYMRGARIPSTLDEPLNRLTLVEINSLRDELDEIKKGLTR